MALCRYGGNHIGATTSLSHICNLRTEKEGLRKVKAVSLAETEVSQIDCGAGLASVFSAFLKQQKIANWLLPRCCLLPGHQAPAVLGDEKLAIDPRSSKRRAVVGEGSPRGQHNSAFQNVQGTAGNSVAALKQSPSERPTIKCLTYCYTLLVEARGTLASLCDCLDPKVIEMIVQDTKNHKQKRNCTGSLALVACTPA